MFAFKQTGCLCLAKQAGTQTMDAANCGGGEDACASQELERRFVLQGGADQCTTLKRSWTQSECYHALLQYCCENDFK